MQLAVKDISGKDTGRKASLNKAVFGIEPNDHAIYLDVKQYHANQRQGTHKARERADIKGSTRKLRKQKGSGAARVGSIKSPIFRGGGRVFGPKPRDYSFKLNKKVKKLARMSALTYKAIDKNITVVEDINLDDPKTKSYIEILNNMEMLDSKTLFVTSGANQNLYLASRNVPGTKVVSAT
ncbi:MAG: 50S ribosomal protein L4, partial [Bacteroidia bacterium]|nr:50S ribosomal protein L4 [Bacteroidia bacterium]